MPQNKNVTLFWTLYSPLIGQRILPSLSLAYLAKVLVKHDIPVKCIDANLLVYDKWKYEAVTHENKQAILDKLIRETERTKPRILGIGYWTEGVSFVREFVKQIKRRNPRLIIVVGGPSATFLTEEIFKFIPEVDYIARGEGELTLLELAQRIFAGHEARGVAGISYRHKQKIIHNQDRALIKNLDELPLVDFEDFVYLGELEGLGVLTSRGCPHHCGYCPDSGFYGQYRIHSPAYIIKQIKHLRKLYQARYITFLDDNVIIDPFRAVKLFGALATENLECDFPISARADHLNPAVFKFLAQAKVTWITVGVENIVPHILKYYQRAGNTAVYIAQVRRTVELMEKYKMRGAFNFVLGSPVESRDDLRKNLLFMRDLDRKGFVIYASLLRPVPGSRFWRQYEAGEMKMFPRSDNSTGFPFDDDYLDIPWICPVNFAFEHEFYSRRRYLENCRYAREFISHLRTSPR